MAKKYSKLNFVDAVKIVIPEVYLNQDIDVSGSEVKLTDDVINSHLVSMKNVGSTLNISSLSNSNSFSALNGPKGFGKFFIKQNALTKITTNSFERKILRPLNTKISDFDTSGDFKKYVSGTLLPKIRLYNGSWDASSLLANTSSLYAPTASATHEYLISNLSWLYFLNTSATLESPSALVTNAIVDNFYYGKSYLINDALKDYQQYIWDNYATFRDVDAGFLPTKFLSGTGTYTSGTQSLDKLKTLIDVIYSPLYIDREDETVKDAIENFIGADTKLQTTEVAGPFHKFLRALSYTLRDLDNQMEEIETLGSIQDCPQEFLPYLANLVGWTLYGNDPASWRNQIQNAMRLYKKKGTKQGLIDAMNTIIVQNPIDVSSAITELYESYIPNILYYLLKTETDIFDMGGNDGYNSAVANELGIQDFDGTSNDQNIRFAVDHILKAAVERYPYLFFLRNEPYRVNILRDGKGYFGPVNKFGNWWWTGVSWTPSSLPLAVLRDPNFEFEYRGRVFGIPPWEEEKFYRNCVVTQDLLDFYKRQLTKFCVPSEVVDESFRYIQEYTLSGTISTDLYLDNGYVFYTSAQQFPPNYNQILSESEWSDFDALSLWNGKSSTFDFTVCAGPFSNTFFGESSALHTTEEIINSLDVVEDFTPAKAIARTRMILSNHEYPSGIDAVCPSIHWPINDFAVGSGVLANFETSGVWDRITGFANGNNFYPSFNDSRSTVEHSGVPVFRRVQSRYSNNIANSVLNTVRVVPLGTASVSSVNRRSLRRRNFYNVLGKDKWYTRDGYNMPSRYDNTSSLPYSNAAASALGALPLGIIPSSLSFADGSPRNLSGVYSRDCDTSTSTKAYFGLSVSEAYLTRGGQTLQFSGCDQYVRRDRLSEEILLLFNFNEKKRKAIARDILNLNYTQLSPSASWYNIEDSFANRLEDIGFEKYLSPVLDLKSLGMRPYYSDGIQSVYNDYNTYFLSSTFGSGVPESVIPELPKGGPNIFSHTYGPIYYNANFSVDGSAVGVSSQLISTDTNDPYIINLARDYKKFIPVGVTKMQTITKPYIGFPEYHSPLFLSSITLIDTSAVNGEVPRNKFILYNLSPNQSSRNPYDDNYLIENQSVYMKYGNHGLPRTQFSLRPTGINTLRNVLIPNHDFELSLDYLTGSEDSREIGGGKVGVLIRTKVEETTESGEYVFFAWTPDNEWKMVRTSEITNGNKGITAVYKKYAHIIEDNNIKQLTLDSKCDDSTENNSVLRSVNKSDIRRATIKFHTSNQKTKVPVQYGTFYKSGAQASVYNGQNVKLHRANLAAGGKSQNYFVEIFPIPKNADNKFVLLDKINLVDKTLNEGAQIPYEATIPDLTNQQDQVVGTKFLLPNGKPVDFTTVTFTETTTEDNSLADLFRRHGSASYLSELWGRTGANAQTDTYNGATGNLVAGANLINRFLAGSPTLNPYASLYNGASKAVWGKIPTTAPMNTTWGTYKDGPNESNVGLLNNITEQILGAYWKSRKGFLSENTWSPYINVGKRRSVLNGIPGNGVNSILGPGKYSYVWLGNSVNYSQIFGNTYSVKRGIPLLALARPGHSYDEQDIRGSWFDGGIPNIVLPSINPLGYSSTDDEVDFTQMDGELLDYPPVYNNPVSVGAPIHVEFTSRRVKPISDNVSVSLLNQDSSWETVPYPGPQPLKELITDPLGYVPSSLAISQLINTNKKPEGELQSQHYNIEVDSPDAWEEFKTEGRGLTFPPQSMYRDILKDNLVDGQVYTFSMYVQQGIWVKDNSNFDANEYATSAILTIAPIGSKTEYARLTISLPRATSEGLGTPTSSVEVGTLEGGSYMGAAGGELQTSSMTVFASEGTERNWYRMSVKIPYHTSALDKSEQPNLGLRCTLQAYNHFFDDDPPVDMEELEPDGGPRRAISRQIIPCKLTVWGHTLVEGSRPPVLSRIPATITRMGRGQINNEEVNTTLKGSIVNVPIYAIADEISTDTIDVAQPKQCIYGDDKKLYIYSKGVSGLQKLTALQTATYNTLYKSDIYNQFNIYDNSGALYSGKMQLEPGDKLIRPKYFATEPYERRILTVSGARSGTEITRKASGVIPVEPRELLHLFRFYNGLGKKEFGPAGTLGGFNTRREYDSSSTHGQHGGSRVSYRTNPDHSTIGTTRANYLNFTILEVED